MGGSREDLWGKPQTQGKKNSFPRGFCLFPNEKDRLAPGESGKNAGRRKPSQKNDRPQGEKNLALQMRRAGLEDDTEKKTARKCLQKFPGRGREG